MNVSFEQLEKVKNFYIERKKAKDYESALFWLEVYILLEKYIETKDENLLYLIIKKLKMRLESLLEKL